MTLYENQETKAHEAAVAARAARVVDASFQKFPISYQIDGWFAHGGKPVRLVEIKCRTYHRDDFETFMIDASKIEAGLRWAKLMDVPFVLIVQWTDQCCALVVTDDTDISDVQWGGRADRQDQNDMEPVIHFKQAKFKKLWDGDESTHSD